MVLVWSAVSLKLVCQSGLAYSITLLQNSRTRDSLIHISSNSTCSICCGFVVDLRVYWVEGNNWLDLNKLITCGKMSDTDDDYVLYALMSAASVTTLIITLVADADATKHKRRPRWKHILGNIEILESSRVLRRVQQLYACRMTCCHLT